MQGTYPQHGLWILKYAIEKHSEKKGHLSSFLPLSVTSSRAFCNLHLKSSLVFILYNIISSRRILLLELTSIHCNSWTKDTGFFPLPMCSNDNPGALVALHYYIRCDIYTPWTFRLTLCSYDHKLMGKSVVFFSNYCPILLKIFAWLTSWTRYKIPRECQDILGVLYLVLP